MIGMVTGTITDKYGSTVIVDVAGLGYEVQVSNTDWGNLGQGKKASLYIYEHIREDAHDLYGFSSRVAKEFFLQLLSVNGVGPKVALAIMSAASLDRLQSAIQAGEIDVFRGVSGVGKKTAERIMLDLSGKIITTPANVPTNDTVYQALVGLGYSSAQAAEAASKVPSSITDDATRVKAALKLL